DEQPGLSGIAVEIEVPADCADAVHCRSIITIVSDGCSAGRTGDTAVLGNVDHIVLVAAIHINAMAAIAGGCHRAVDVQADLVAVSAMRGDILKENRMGIFSLSPDCAVLCKIKGAVL